MTPEPIATAFSLKNISRLSPNGLGNVVESGNDNFFTFSRFDIF